MTEVEICNAALAALALGGIQSLDDDSDPARACKTWYPLVRDKVLEDRIWSFAKEQYILAPDAQAPKFGFARRFQVPQEVVRVHRVDDGSGEYRAAWDLQGRFILGDFEAAYVTAVKRQADSSLFSPGFALTVGLRLAATLAVPLKENRQLKADLWGEYQFELKEAAGADGAQGKAEVIRSDKFKRARY